MNSIDGRIICRWASARSVLVEVVAGGGSGGRSSSPPTRPHRQLPEPRASPPPAAESQSPQSLRRLALLHPPVLLLPRQLEHRPLRPLVQLRELLQGRDAAERKLAQPPCLDTHDTRREARAAGRACAMSRWRSKLAFFGCAARITSCEQNRQPRRVAGGAQGEFSAACAGAAGRRRRRAGRRERGGRHLLPARTIPSSASARGAAASGSSSRIVAGACAGAICGPRRRQGATLRRVQRPVHSAGASLTAA